MRALAVASNLSCVAVTESIRLTVFMHARAHMEMCRRKIVRFYLSLEHWIGSIPHGPWYGTPRSSRPPSLTVYSLERWLTVYSVKCPGRGTGCCSRCIHRQTERMGSPNNRSDRPTGWHRTPPRSTKCPCGPSSQLAAHNKLTARYIFLSGSELFRAAISNPQI